MSFWPVEPRVATLDLVPGRRSLVVVDITNPDGESLSVALDAVLQPPSSGPVWVAVDSAVTVDPGHSVAVFVPVFPPADLSSSSYRLQLRLHPAGDGDALLGEAAVMLVVRGGQSWGVRLVSSVPGSDLMPAEDHFELSGPAGQGYLAEVEMVEDPVIGVSGPSGKFPTTSWLDGKAGDFPPEGKVSVTVFTDFGDGSSAYVVHLRRAVSGEQMAVSDVQTPALELPLQSREVD